MWSTLFGALCGFGLMSIGIVLGLSRKPQYITVEKTGLDGVRTVTEEYRPLRWGGRLLMFALAVLGLYIFTVSVAPSSVLATRATAALTWLLPVVMTTGVGASLAGMAGWLFYRRVLGFGPSLRIRAADPHVAVVSGVSRTVTVDSKEEADFVQEALAGEAVEQNTQRLFRALAAHRFGALVLAVALLGAAWYLFGKVPAAWRGDYDSAMSVFLTWEMAFGAAEAVAFLLIPLGLLIGIVVTLVTGGEEIGSMFGALCFFGVIGVIAYYTGFIDPLFDMIGRLR
jgi:hypothetical protein